MSENLVLLTEVAAAMGGSDEVTVASMVKGKLRQDWLGRPALDVELAAELVSGYENRHDAVTAKRAAYEQYLVDRDRQRSAHVREVTNAARPRVHAEQTRKIEASFTRVSGLEHVGLGPAAREELREIARGAAAEWDAKNPPADWETFA